MLMLARRSLIMLTQSIDRSRPGRSADLCRSTEVRLAT